jgi:hypothetical protein
MEVHSEYPVGVVFAVFVRFVLIFLLVVFVFCASDNKAIGG